MKIMFASKIFSDLGYFEQNEFLFDSHTVEIGMFDATSIEVGMFDTISVQYANFTKNKNK